MKFYAPGWNIFFNQQNNKSAVVKTIFKDWMYYRSKEDMNSNRTSIIHGYFDNCWFNEIHHDIRLANHE